MRLKQDPSGASQTNRIWRRPILYRPVLKLQSVRGEDLVCLCVSGIGDTASEPEYRRIAVCQRRVGIPLHALPCDIGNWRGEQ